MNLEVIGENGSGVLNLPEVYILGSSRPLRLNGDATWTYNDTSHLIEVSGESYLAGLGVDEAYASILKMVDSESASEIVYRCEVFDAVLEQCGAKPRKLISPEFRRVRIPNPDPKSDVPYYRMEAKSEWKRQPLTFSELHPHYRIPMLKIYADALSRIGREADAVTALRDLADFEISRAEELLNEEEARRDLDMVKERLLSANASLRSANQIEPVSYTHLTLPTTPYV